MAVNIVRRDAQLDEASKVQDVAKEVAADHPVQGSMIESSKDGIHTPTGILTLPGILTPATPGAQGGISTPSGHQAPPAFHAPPEYNAPTGVLPRTTQEAQEAHKVFHRDNAWWSDPTYVKDYCTNKLETFIPSGHFSYIDWEDDMGSGKCWRAQGLTWYQQGIEKKQGFYCQSHTTSFEGNCWNLNKIVPGDREWRKVYCDNELKSYEGFELPLGTGDLPLGQYGDSGRCWTEKTIINDKPRANWYQDGIMEKIKDWCDKHPKALDKNERQYNSQCDKK